MRRQSVGHARTLLSYFTKHLIGRHFHHKVTKEDDQRRNDVHRRFTDSIFIAIFMTFRKDAFRKKSLAATTTSEGRERPDPLAAFSTGRAFSPLMRDNVRPY